MKTRLYKFYARTYHTSDTTIVIDLNMVDEISNIILMFEFYKTGVVQTAHPLAAVKKIELVDGSDVLYSLDGFEAEALDWYDNWGKFRSNYNYCNTGGTITRCIGINFGRYLFDEEYGFDPKRFNNPQLRITLDIDGWAATGTGIYVTGYANLFDEFTPSLKGMFMAKELKSWTMAAATHEYTELPTDYPYRGIYFRPYLLGTEPNQAVSNIKISEDQDKKVPYDLDADSIVRSISDRYPMVEEAYWFSLDTSNRYLFIAPTTRVTAVGAVWAEAAVAQDAAFYDGDGGRLKTIAAANPSNTQIFVRGWIPHAVYEIPVCDKDVPSTYWDVSRNASLKADITGAASATGYLFLQQLRPY
jgi:hypothetical protein